MPERKPNALGSEKSPYLLRHAFNPVQWRPWGDEALRKAKNDGKPILLSIGYMACHWCEVMARESFEDEETAEIINRSFIPIKVDREERPDVDSYFMNAAQAMTGSGGWPLNVFLTPDLQPFYAGTYFPPEPRYGMPSFKQVLEFVARVWKERREEAMATGRNVTASLLAEGSQKGGQLSRDLVVGAYDSLVASFDPTHGGFGPAPKFPLPLSVSFMLRHHFRTGKDLALKAATKTLDAIASGGIRDHVGGGFHRYATDRNWLIPHFEKMLCDNALLAKAYVEAYQVTKSDGYAQVARETLDWMRREMEASQGGFYSAQDADTSEGEGVFYTWTPDEVETVLGKEDAERFCNAFGVTRTGNFEGGRSVLHVRGEAAPQAELARWKAKLYAARGARPKPPTDTKVVTSWNGLAISALACAGAVLREQAYLGSANRAADFVLSQCHREKRLLRRYADGDAGIDGVLEDYAFLVQGLLDLFESTSDPGRLEQAIQLAEEMAAEFLDTEAGGFYSSRDTRLARTKESYDGPTPSGNSVAAMDLLRLSELTGDVKFRALAERALEAFRDRLEEQPSGHASMACAVDSLLNGMKEVVITASKGVDAEPMVTALRSEFQPAAVVMVVDGSNFARLSELSSLTEGRRPKVTPQAFVCENFACRLPASTPEELVSQLKPEN